MRNGVGLGCYRRATELAVMPPFGVLLLAIAFGPVDRAILPVFALMSILFFSR
jgi:hypothetical protein